MCFHREGNNRATGRDWAFAAMSFVLICFMAVGLAAIKEAVVALAERADSSGCASASGVIARGASNANAAVARGGSVRMMQSSGGHSPSSSGAAAGAGVTASLTLHGPGSMKLGAPPSRQQSLAANAAGNCSMRDMTAAGEGGAPGGDGALPPLAATSRAYQVLVLSQRFFKSWARTPALLGEF